MKDEQYYINQFRLVLQAIHLTRSSIKFYEAKGYDNTDNLEKLAGQQEEFEEIKKQLESFGKERSVNSYYNLIAQISEDNSKLRYDRDGHSLDPDQGLILKNYLFDVIARNMQASIDYPGLNISPFQYNHGKFNHEPLKNYIGEILNYLHQNSEIPQNYVELYYFLQDLLSKYWDFVRENYPINYHN